MAEDVTISKPTEGEIVETLEFPWSRRENEPENWYMRFFTYYLILGPTRTLMRAFMSFVQKEQPERYEAFILNPPNGAAGNWAQMASAWEWRKRARAYDEALMRESMLTIDEAYQTIVANTKKAADTLVKSLDNPRLAVAAAKEILDRGGLPGSSTVRHEVVPFTADELHKANQEVDEWRKRLNSPNETSESSG